MIHECDNLYKAQPKCNWGTTGVIVGETLCSTSLLAADFILLRVAWESPVLRQLNYRLCLFYSCLSQVFLALGHIWDFGATESSASWATRTIVFWSCFYHLLHVAALRSWRHMYRYLGRRILGTFTGKKHIPAGERVFTSQKTDVSMVQASKGRVLTTHKD